MAKQKHQKVQVVTLAKENEEVYLLLLQMKEDRNFLWQNVTGSVDPGESFSSAAKRELLEETGINAEVQELPINFEFHDRWGKDVLEKCYLAIIETKEQVIKLDPQEHQDSKWISINEANESHFGYPSNYKAYQSALESLC